MVDDDELVDHVAHFWKLQQYNAQQCASYLPAGSLKKGKAVESATIGSAVAADF